MINAIIFDIGGVIAYDIWEHMLLNPVEGIAELYGLPKSKVEDAGKLLWEKYAYIPVKNEIDIKNLEMDYWQSFIDEFHITESVQYFMDYTDNFVKPIQNIESILAELKNLNIELAICSNNNEFWFKRQSTKLNLFEYFKEENIFLSSRVGYSKTNSNFEMFRAAISKLNSKKEDCLFIDDKMSNINVALDYGIAGILFPRESAYGANYLRSLFSKMGIMALRA